MEKKLIILGWTGAGLIALSFILPIVYAEVYLTSPENSTGYVGSGMNLVRGFIVPDENAGLGGGTHFRMLPRNYFIFLTVPLMALLAAICLFVKNMHARLIGCLAGMGGIAFCIVGYNDFAHPISNEYTWTWSPGYGFFIDIAGGVIVIISCGILAWKDWKREKKIEEYLDS